MLRIEYLQEILIISIALSVITCALIQKIKFHFKSKNRIILYSLIINLVVGLAFCKTFTDINFPISLWVGLFSFIGADTIYRTLENKLSSYTDQIKKNSITIPKSNIINEEVK